MHYRFWQRGGGYDRNATDPAAARAMIELIHNNRVHAGVGERLPVVMGLQPRPSTKTVYLDSFFASLS